MRSAVSIIFKWSLIVTLFMAAGCATARPPLVVQPGMTVQTVRSTFSATLSGIEGGGSGRGYLIFKRPDQLHLAILSPFGSSVLEFFSNGDAITCLIPTRLAAYQGRVTELPDRGVLHQWALMRWVLAPPPLPSPSGSVTQVLPDGRRETVYFLSNGLVERKVTEDGETVVYSDYRNVGDAVFPERIEVTSGDKARVRVEFTDTEVNVPIEEESLQPKVEGFTVFPLAALAPPRSQ